MWHREYRDYKPDQPMIKYQVSPGHGIIGCEMHDIFGWGANLHVSKKKRKKRGFLGLLFGKAS